MQNSHTISRNQALPIFTLRSEPDRSVSKAKDKNCDKLPTTKEMWGKIKKTEDTISSQESVSVPEATSTE